MNTTLILALTFGAPALKDKPDARPAIEGHWRVEYRTDSGSRTDDSNLWIFSPKGVAEIRNPSGDHVVSELTYTLTKGEAHKVCDFMESQGNGKFDQRLGIYKIEGDTLTLSFLTGENTRPSSFDHSKEAGYIVIVMKRVKE